MEFNKYSNLLFSLILSVGFLILQINNKATAQTLVVKKPIRPSVLKIVNEIATSDRLEGDMVGYAGKPSEQRRRLKELTGIATNEELRALTDYRNGVVRCYAFHAMAARGDSALLPILLAHLNDTTTVFTLSYDMGSYKMVGDYFVDVVTPGYVDVTVYKLNSGQTVILDSVLLNKKGIYLEAKNRLIGELKPEPGYYSRVRQIVVEENNAVALLALARYKDTSDIRIIQPFLKKPGSQYFAVYAVRGFPDENFYPALVKIFNHEWAEKLYDYQLWRIIYQALAQYPTNQTLELFKRTIHTRDDFRYQTLGADLMIALTKYPNPLWDGLKGQIKLDSYHLEEVQKQMDIEK